MRRAMMPATILATIILVAGSIHARLPAGSALQRMKAAEGLAVTLFAAEPDLVNPTAMDIDAQGRVWVTEAANYRLFKNHLTRKGGDRIRILEDTNGDGRCDKATTFYEDPSLQAPLGIAVLGNRVYVCQSPDLFYLEDTDGDGVADKKTVVLTGFKGVDHDHAIHGVIFGPDGYLYMSNGDSGLDVTDKQGNRIRVGANAEHMAASVLRTDLEGNRLELLAEGLRNPFEPAVDSFGNVFISDNDDDGNQQCRIVFVMEGGNYGYWPRRKGDRSLDAVHWNEDIPGIVPKILKTGFGSPTGMIFYEGTLLPPQYQRSLIHADAGPGVIRSYPVRGKGAAYSAQMQTLLSCPGDKWFRPIDVATAPDGSVFVADWYDPGVGGHNIGDFERGRIYRLAPLGAPSRQTKFDVSNPAGAAAALASPNQAIRFMAFQALNQDKSESALRELQSLWSQNDEVLQARALWLLAGRGEEGLKAINEAAQDTRNEFRIQAVRILAAQGPDALKRAAWLLDDPDPGVRREILLRLQRQEFKAAEWSSEWILKLARQFDGQDRFYREALGIAIRARGRDFSNRILQESANKWDRRFAQLALQLHTAEAVDSAAKVLADAGRPVEERLGALEVVAAGGGDPAAEAMIAQLALSAPRPLIVRILELLVRDEGSAWPLVRGDTRLHAFLKESLVVPQLRIEAGRMIRDLRLSGFLPDLARVAGDSKSTIEERISAIDTIRQFQSPAALAPMKALLGDPEIRVALAAARAIGALGTDEAYQSLSAILTDLSKSKAVRKELVRQLGVSRGGALLILQMAEEGKLPQDLVLDAASVTNTSQHENVRLMAQRLLPLPASRSGRTLPPLPALLRMRGDVNKGRAAFFGSDGPQCARCHKIAGEGRAVGPDLSRIGEKLARDALFESILNPSAAIAHEYQVWLLRTKSRGFLDGYIRSETGNDVELMDSNGNIARIPTSEILARTKGTTSLMPTGLSSGMTAKELVDLVEFLSTLK